MDFCMCLPSDGLPCIAGEHPGSIHADFDSHRYANPSHSNDYTNFNAFPNTFANLYA